MTLGPALAGIATAMMDISDGLVGDLEHIAEASGVAAVIDASRLPLSTAAATVLAEAVEHVETVLTGGDDYELLFTAPPDAVLPQIPDVPGTAIGRIEAGSVVRVLDRDGGDLPLTRRGFRHG